MSTPTAARNTAPKTATKPVAKKTATKPATGKPAAKPAQTTARQTPIAVFVDAISAVLDVPAAQLPARVAAVRKACTVVSKNSGGGGVIARKVTRELLAQFNG
jgi:hypothetical protein